MTYAMEVTTSKHRPLWITVVAKPQVYRFKDTQQAEVNWHCSKQWMNGEIEADRAFVEGRTIGTFSTVEEFLESLDAE